MNFNPVSQAQPDRLKLGFNKVFRVLKKTEIIYVAPDGQATVVSREEETASFYPFEKIYPDPMRFQPFE
jgi:hypothetical protein